MSDAWALYLGTFIPVLLILVLSELKAIRAALERGEDADANQA